ITPAGTGDLCNVGKNVLGDECSRILLIGGIGYTGRHVAKASIVLGHPTYLLVRQSTASNPQKAELLESFKASGANIVHGSLEDHASLVETIKKWMWSSPQWERLRFCAFARTASLQIHCLCKTFHFFQVLYGRESHRRGSVSYQNIHEAQFALQLCELLQRVTKLAGIK
ncbi:hypothetical protein KI387_005418, partial [Taxus chinensis]